MSEQVLAVVKSFSSGKPDSIVVVIPKEAGLTKPQKFLVKKDAKGRLIYEPIEQ